MRPLFLVLIVAMTCPTAASKELDFGPLEVKVEAEPSPHCTIGLDREVCIASWKEEGNPQDLSDDEIAVTRFANRVKVSVEVPGQGPRQEIAVNPESLSFEHPLNRGINESALAANDSLPEAVRERVSLESRTFNWDGSDPPDGIVVRIASPVPIQDPASGSSYDGLTPGIYSWDCQYYFTVQDQSWCSYESVHPFPNGIGFVPTTDMASETPAYDLSCSNLHEGMEHVPQPYCPYTNVVVSVAEDASDTWKDRTPNVRVGGSVDKVAVEVKPVHRGPDQASRNSADLAERRYASMLETPVIPRALPERASKDPVDGKNSTLPHEPGRILSPKLQNQVAKVHAIESVARETAWVRIVAASIALGGVLLVVLFALYFRPVQQEDVLRNPNRLRIYDAIRAEAGIRAGTLHKKLGLNYGTILGHLQVLERAHFIESSDTGQRRYFLNGGSFSTSEKKKIASVSAPTAKRIQAYIGLHGEASLSSIAKALEIPLSTASATVSRLERNGVLVKRHTAYGIRISLPSESAIANSIGLA